MSSPPASAQRLIRFGVFELDARSGELRKSGVRLNVQDQPLQVLTVLLERLGELVTREELRQQLWPSDTFVGFEHGLNAAVGRLRETLGDSAESPRFIETLPRRGYRFIGSVSPNEIPSVGSAGPEGSSRELDAPTPQPRLPSEARRRRVAVLVVGASLMIGAATLGLVVGRRTSRPPVPTFQRLTFRRGNVPAAQFARDDRTVVYAAAWDGDRSRLFSTRLERPESARLDAPDAEVEAVSRSGELLLTLNHELGDYWSESNWTLARMPLAGGAPRPIADHVRGADWGPDGSVAAVRNTGGRSRLEYPLGHVLYEGEWLDAPRVSPRGDLVAFWAWESDHRAVEIVDRAGTRRILSTGWKWGGKHLLWSPDGKEIWFSAGEGGWVFPLRAVSLSGDQRVLLQLPNSIVPNDVSSDGRLLITVSNGRSLTKCLPLGETRERDISWFETSGIMDLSPDGKTALMSEVGGGVGPGPRAAAFLRGTDGSPPIRLGESFPIALSPNGQWVLSIPEPANAVQLLPTGPGEPRALDFKGLEFVGWFPDSTRLLLSPPQAGRDTRCYSLDIESGKRETLTRDGLACSLPSPSGDELLVRNQEGKWFTYSLATQAAREIPGLEATDAPTQWAAGRHSIFVERQPLPLAKIDVLDLDTGHRQQWREIILSDPAGLVRGQSSVLMATNGSYCYTYQQNLGDLFLVEGVR